MRRTIPIAILTVVLAAGSALAGASGRRVEREYRPAETHPSFPQGGIRSSSTVTFRPRAHERSVMVVVQDDSGLVVPGQVLQDLDGDGDADRTHEFCGSTSEAVAIDPNAPVKVARYHGSCDDPADPMQLGAWTKGTVTATFTR
ncbi:MAG TPA: hypothetical protein VHN37_10225 [Actinomycetota bacterium]|nr:hypothetical protein [Actinomycetota bacterium]